MLIKPTYNTTPRMVVATTPATRRNVPSLIRFFLYTASRGQGWHLEKIAHTGVHHFSAIRDHGLADDFILEVQLQLAVFHHIEQERGEIAGVHLAGVVGDAGGQVDGADDGYAISLHRFSGACEFAVAAALGREVDDDRTGRHAFHHVGGDEHGRLFSGDDRGGDDHVAFRDHAGQQFALAGVEIFVLRGAVATGILRVLGFDGKFDEAAAQALHLLFGGGTHVIRRSYG